MSKSSVPCKRAMRSLGLSWDGIRPKHGIILGRMSTGVGRACCEARFPCPVYDLDFGAVLGCLYRSGLPSFIVLPARSLESCCWTLFGPYTVVRWGPLENGLPREISNFGWHGTPENPPVQLEVLAGAISWGFKSPSPHHILNELAALALTLFT